MTGDGSVAGAILVLEDGAVFRGTAYGATDANAGQVIDGPIAPPDLQATVLHLLGLDHETDGGEMAALEHDLRARLGVEGEKRRPTKARSPGPTRERRCGRGLKPGLGVPKA